jgi:hypothetical protein
MKIEDIQYLIENSEEAVPPHDKFYGTPTDKEYCRCLYENTDDLLEAAFRHWSCQWLVNAGQGQTCHKQVEFEDATDGKRLCKEHGAHLQARFGRNLKIVAP